MTRLTVVDWILAALCGAWLLALVWIGHPENDLLAALWSSTMASWVQAIGSVAAVVAVALIAKAEFDRAQRNHEDAETVLLETLIGLAGEARAAAKRLEEHAAIMEAVGSSPDPLVEAFQRHCVRSKEALALLLTGRSASAALLLKAADLSELLAYRPSKSALTNPVIARFDGARYENDFSAIETVLKSLR